MAATYPLNIGKSADVAASGEALVSIAVPRLESWVVTRIAVLVSTAVLEPTARVYVDAEAPLNFLAGTYTGSNDSSDESLRLRPGQLLICRWTGADVGAGATLSVFGEKTM